MAFWRTLLDSGMDFSPLEMQCPRTSRLLVNTAVRLLVFVQSEVRYRVDHSVDPKEFHVSTGIECRRPSMHRELV